MKALLQTLFFFILVTQICFAQWYQQNSGTTRNLNGVSFYDLNNGIAVGDSGIILGTTNGGTNWIVAPPSGNNTNLYAVANKPGNWVAVGSEGIIIHNGNIQTSGTTKNLFAVSFPSANYGTAVGDSGTILKTIDGGQNWFPQSSGTSDPLLGVSFTNKNNGLAVGGMGTILKTTDGGQSWVNQPNSISGFTYEVALTDINHGFVVGSTKPVSGPNNQFILGTTDGGLNWTLVCGGFGGVKSISFFDTNIGMSVGYTYDNEANTIGEILKTTDGGESWVSQSLITNSQLLGVSLIDANNGWAVGEGGNILHTTHGGVTFVEEEQIEEMPQEFLLSQNYPNPFNSSTTFRYSIPNASKVIIKVYDILGNEIETLVNEEKPAGTYNVEFTINNLQLSSGVYFYQIKATPSGGQAGSFVETKKMLLLK